MSRVLSLSEGRATSQSMSRVLSLSEGRAMVVSDLHGQWDLYVRYRDHFLDLHNSGDADYLIFSGDLIHADGYPHPDGSLKIILDIIKLKKELGEKLIYLLGNHELVHLYAIPLQKGDVSYTHGFEAAMGKHRKKITALFDSLPFFVRTVAGISIGHAGAAATLADPESAKTIFNLSHKKLWMQAHTMIPVEQLDEFREEFARLNQIDYESNARELLAITGPEDPRYNDLLWGMVLRGLPEFEGIWETFMNGNERDYGEQGYSQILSGTLAQLSEGFVPQVGLISGHMVTPRGAQIIAEHQLRIASGVHARPFEAAKFLVFDMGKAQSITDLAKGVQNL
jgi:predicted phosphodiesterase